MPSEVVWLFKILCVCPWINSAFSQYEGAILPRCPSRYQKWLVWTTAVIKLQTDYNLNLNDRFRHIKVLVNITTDVNSSTCVGIFNLSNCWIQLNVQAIRQSHRNTRVTIPHCTKQIFTSINRCSRQRYPLLHNILIKTMTKHILSQQTTYTE